MNSDPLMTILHVIIGIMVLLIAERFNGELPDSPLGGSNVEWELLPFSFDSQSMYTGSPVED